MPSCRTISSAIISDRGGDTTHVPSADRPAPTRPPTRPPASPLTPRPLHPPGRPAGLDRHDSALAGVPVHAGRQRLTGTGDRATVQAVAVAVEDDPHFLGRDHRAGPRGRCPPTAGARGAAAPGPAPPCSIS